MLDAMLRPIIDGPLDAAGRRLSRYGLSATGATMLGLALGLAAAAAVAWQAYAAAFALILLNRLLDGLDGALARATTPTLRGGYLDIVVDYVFYAGIPLGFAIADPGQNALPAAALLAGFCLTCSSFLSFAAIAAACGLQTEAHGRKAFFYSTGVVEGTETILFFLLMTIIPSRFAELAWLFAALCVVTAVQRAVWAMRVFR